MNGKLSIASFLKLVSGRRGHFRLESGHHSDLWLDLDPLFADPRAVDPFVTALSGAPKRSARKCRVSFSSTVSFRSASR